MLHSDGRMRNAVKRIGLHGRVVNHIFEDNLLPYFQLVVKLPITHPVARETAVATKTI